MKPKIIPSSIMWPFILLTTLFFAWAVPNNMTDTLLAAFKRIMSFSDSKTAWIQVVCYLLGYGFCAIPGALFIKKYSYKSGILLALSLYTSGALLFYPAMLCLQVNADISFLMYLFAMFILFAGLSILETSANSYVYAIGPEETSTQRLNFAQSFNPVGAITSVIISQIFVLSRLNTMTAQQRANLNPDELVQIQGIELNAITMTYLVIGLVMIGLILAFYFTKMPNLKEGEEKMDFAGTFRRLTKNKNYVWGVVAQFFYVGAQIAVWSFIIQYVMRKLNLDQLVLSLGADARPEAIMSVLRNVEPVAAGFYNICERIGLDVLLPRTAEQAGATYYIMSLVLFFIGRFACTALMRFFQPKNMLALLAVLAVVLCLMTIYAEGFLGIYALRGISGCMSMMFPTIYGMGIKGLGEDTKLGGAGMIMAIAGAAVLTQIQGIVSDSFNIIAAYWIPTIAFMVITFYSIVVCKKI